MYVPPQIFRRSVPLRFDGKCVINLIAVRTSGADAGGLVAQEENQREPGQD
jgi:hypothetical protein